MEENSLVFPSFEELMQQLQPDLERMEEIRLQSRKQCLKNWLITTASLLVIVIAIFLYLGAGIETGLLFTFIASIILLFVLGGMKSKTINSEYKKNVVQPFVSHLVENGNYNPSSGIPLEIFAGCNLFKYPDRYSAEDLISGTIGKTSIEFSEVHAEEKYTTTDSKGRTETHWRDIFRGFVFVADFHKDFSGRTEICRNSWLKFRGKRVKMENTTFEKCFDVYSTDQMEARYILSVSMMERILELENKFRKKDMVISFWDSNVIIAVRDRTNHFEANVWSSVMDTKKLHREYSIIRSFAEVVEDLNLNLRIWTKE